MSAQAQARILIADDDETFRISLSRYLKNEGYECVVVTDAAEAGAQLRQGAFDVLLCDIGMPGNEHLEFISQLPQVASGMPVILLTGSPTVETAVASVRLPVVAYLTKPPDLDEMKRVIAQAVASHRVLRTVREDLQSLQELSEHLTRAQSELTDRRQDPGQEALRRKVAPALEHAIVALSDMRRSTRSGPDQAVQQIELVQALRETIDVLEKTKRSFKSRQLGALREKLETLLRP